MVDPAVIVGFLLGLAVGGVGCMIILHDCTRRLSESDAAMHRLASAQKDLLAVVSAYRNEKEMFDGVHRWESNNRRSQRAQ